jgi:hypothetical protein
MHNQQSVRVQAVAEGGLEVVLVLSPEAIEAAEDIACRLQITREEALLDFFGSINESVKDSLPENLSIGWVFPTEAAAQDFKTRDNLGDYYGVYPVEDGGWIVEHCALREIGRGLDTVSTGDPL